MTFKGFLMSGPTILGKKANKACKVQESSRIFLNSKLEEKVSFKSIISFLCKVTFPIYINIFFVKFPCHFFSVSLKPVPDYWPSRSDNLCKICSSGHLAGDLTLRGRRPLMKSLIVSRTARTSFVWPGCRLSKSSHICRRWRSHLQCFSYKNYVETKNIMQWARQ